MTLEQDFKALMPATITRAAYSSQDAYGKVTHGAGTNFSARVLRKQEKVLDRDGNEKVANTVVWIYGSPAWDVRDKITLPDGTTPPILQIAVIPDEGGDHHSRLWLG